MSWMSYVSPDSPHVRVTTTAHHALVTILPHGHLEQVVQLMLTRGQVEALLGGMDGEAAIQPEDLKHLGDAVKEVKS